MKKILIIAPNMTKGGMERQLSLFLENFDRRVLTVTLALFDNKIEYPIPTDIELINLDKKKKIDLLFLYKLFKLIKSGNFDVINSKISGVNEYVMFMCGILNKKNVVLEVRSSGNRLFKYYTRMKIIHKIFKKPWIVVCNSRKACLEIEQYLPASEIFLKVVHNGIDTDKFSIGELHKTNNIFTIGFVGRMERVKNIETLVKAAHLFLNKKKTANIELFFVGNKNSEYFLEINSLVKELNVENLCQFIDPVNDIENYYNKFDLFVLSSHMEGTPNVLLEAMSCGCVSLVSKGANSDNFLSKEFEFTTTNTEELSEKIEYVFNMDIAKKKSIGVVNRQYIIDNYSIQNMVNGLTEILYI